MLQSRLHMWGTTPFATLIAIFVTGEAVTFALIGTTKQNASTSRSGCGKTDSIGCTMS